VTLKKWLNFSRDPILGVNPSSRYEAILRYFTFFAISRAVMDWFSSNLVRWFTSARGLVQYILGLSES